MLHYTPDTYLAVVEEIQRVLSDESKWCQFSFGKDAQGEPCSYTHPEVAQFCLAGAALRACDNLGVSSEVGTGARGPYTMYWNDTSGRTYREVQRALEERVAYFLDLAQQQGEWK
jgi:hypothetical protein